MVISSEDKQMLLDYLNSQRLMAVATYGSYPWIAWVYYVVDEELNFYFISPPDAEHSQQIMNNSKVACAVADSSQKASDKKIGVQLWGKANVETVVDKIKWMFEMYGKLHPGVKDVFTLERFQKQITDYDQQSL